MIWNGSIGRIAAPAVFIVLLTLAMSTFDSPARGEPVHALVIGIDSYRSQGGAPLDLRGAVNDARDIAAALDELGAVSVRMLLNEDAHREAIFTTWREMRDAASPGDTLVLTYAGHGAQEPERIPGSTPNGMHSVTVLGGFRIESPHNQQRIFDYEWRELVAESSDYNVILVFDACHSGSMNREVGLPGIDRPTSTRFSSYGRIEDDQLPPPTREQTGIPAALPHEFFIGATLDTLAIEEIQSEGQYRGALSIVLADALGGLADRNRDGILQRFELAQYVKENTRALSDQRQMPVVQYDGIGTSRADDAPLFALPKTTPLALSACIAEAKGAIPKLLPVRRTDELNLPGLAGLPVEEVSEEGSASVTFSHDAMGVPAAYNRYLDQIALLGHEPDAKTLARLVERSRVMPAFERLMGCQPPLMLRLTDGLTERSGDLFHEGTHLDFRLEPREHPNLTIFNVTGGGEIQFLYPQKAKDLPEVNPRVEFGLKFEVRSPFGADMLVVLTSQTLQSGLHNRVRAIAGPSGGAEAPSLAFDALAEALSEGKHELGILQIHTAPE